MRTQSSRSIAERNQDSLRALRSLRSILLAAAICAGLRRPSAHDLERTNVLLAFERDGSFVLDVANDPSWLKLRLERFPAASPIAIVLWVDGHEVRPASVEFIPGADRWRPTVFAAACRPTRGRCGGTTGW